MENNSKEGICRSKKKEVIKKSVFALLNFDKVFQVDSDASEIEIGEVLRQERIPITLFSENLKEAKNNYYVYDQEFYAIV